MSYNIWYPGRIPLCSVQVIQGLEQYIETLNQAIKTKSSESIEKAERIYQDIYETLWQEGIDCLGSDTDINDLLTLLARSNQAAHLCAKADCWHDLEIITNALSTVQYGLIAKQNNGGTDDGTRC
jgi:hypothetical protein